MKIAIDSRWIFEKISGVGKYTETLILALSQIDIQNEYILIFDDERLLKRTVEKLGLSDKLNIKPLLVSFGIFSIANQVRLPSQLSRLGVDIFHSSNFMMPLFWWGINSRIKKIITIHDIILIHSPHFSPKAIKSKFYYLYKWVTKFIASQADLIFTDSNHSAEDIVKYLAINEAKIETIYMGVDKKFFACRNADNRKKLKSAYGAADSQTIIYVGRQDPYKNISVLIEAFALALQDNLKLKLIIIGEKDKRYLEVFAKVEKLKLTEVVCFSGYIADEALYDYFKIADLLVLPSRYEGFGLPVIEAMAAGVAVICAASASLPEVAGEAALLFDPDDAQQLAFQIKTVLSDEKIRTDLIAKGLRRAEYFSAEKMAKAVLNCYTRIGSR